MTILSGTELIHLRGQGLVKSMIDSDLQTQICGLELTLQKVEGFKSAGSVDFDNSHRIVSDTEELEFDESGWVSLKRGAYLVTYNEVVEVPEDLAAIARPRSSLIRCGATLETALWDPGYRGRSKSLLVVYNPHGLRLEKNARLMQLVFIRLSCAPEKVYSGAYQDENL